MHSAHDLEHRSFNVDAQLRQRSDYHPTFLLSLHTMPSSQDIDTVLTAFLSSKPTVEQEKGMIAQLVRIFWLGNRKNRAEGT